MTYGKCESCRRSEETTHLGVCAKCWSDDMADASAERDAALRRAEEAEARVMELEARASAAHEETRRQLRALRDQIEHEGCMAAHFGERTYECDATAPCGLCRMRGEREETRAQVEALREAIDRSLLLAPSDDAARAAMLDTIGQSVERLRRGEHPAQRERDALAAQVEALRDDVAAAAGELRVPIPEPGSETARLLLANVAMRRERDQARANLSAMVERAADERAQVRREALEESARVCDEEAARRKKGAEAFRLMGSEDADSASDVEYSHAALALYIARDIRALIDKETP